MSKNVSELMNANNFSELTDVCNGAKKEVKSAKKNLFFFINTLNKLARKNEFVNGVNLKELGKKVRNYAVNCGYDVSTNSPFNAYLFINSYGEIQGIQKMVHVAQEKQFYERDYYTPSDDGFKVFDTPFGKVGIVVCFDRHYPESIRTEAIMGADIVLIPTVNTKSEPSEMFEWELRVQAFQNSVAIAMCNRVGVEGEMDFSGESIVVDANGNVIAKADDKEQIIYVDIDLHASDTIRRNKPYTSLRRIELYK